MKFSRKILLSLIASFLFNTVVFANEFDLNSSITNGKCCSSEIVTNNEDIFNI